MKKSYLVGAFACLAALAPSTTAFAATTKVVTEADVVRQPQVPPMTGWGLYTNSLTPPTAGAFVEGPAAPPLGTGSFRTTTLLGSEKVFLYNFTHIGTKLSAVDRIAYSTYRSAGSANQLPALNVQIDFNGPAVANGFSTLVYEPVYNPSQAVVSNIWQSWTATGSGVWWSTGTINGQCIGATDTCDKSWAEIVANNPAATVLGAVGINQGSGNPGLTGATDAFTFDETTYNFESKPDADGDGVTDGDDNCVNVPNPGQEDGDGDGLGTACDQNERPQTKEDCKQGGFAAYTIGNPPRPAFKNQGDCVSSFAPGKSKS